MVDFVAIDLDSFPRMTGWDLDGIQRMTDRMNQRQWIRPIKLRYLWSANFYPLQNLRFGGRQSTVTMVVVTSKSMTL